MAENRNEKTYLLKQVNNSDDIKSKLKPISHTRKSGQLYESPSVNNSWQVNAQIVIFVIFACLLSMTVASKIRFTPVVSHSLTLHFENKFSQQQMEWVGRLYAIVVLCLLPIVCAIIDTWMISYKICLIFSGLLHVIACITNSTVTHPLFFILTDSFVCGLGSAVAFAVFLLAIDDICPKGNRFRVLATTFCQGSTIGSLFVLDLYALLAKYWGWVYFQLFLAGLFGFLAISLVLFCPEYGIKFTVSERVAKIPAEKKRIPLPPPNRILGLTFEEMKSSPSLFSWLVYRFIIEIIHSGLFLLMIQDSHIIVMPDLDSLMKNYSTTTIALIVYSCGESLFYIMGAIFGIFLIGYLLHINIVFLSIFFLMLVIWQPVRSKALHNITYMTVGHIICAGITGSCIGALSTCIIATSEEATMISARRVFPFVKLLEGLAIAISPFFFNILKHVSQQNIWLLTFAVLTAASICLLVYILHKLYMKFIDNSTDRRFSMQASMKPAKFINKAFDSS